MCCAWKNRIILSYGESGSQIISLCWHSAVHNFGLGCFFFFVFVQCVIVVAVNDAINTVEYYANSHFISHSWLRVWLLALSIWRGRNDDSPNNLFIRENNLFGFSDQRKLSQSKFTRQNLKTEIPKSSKTIKPSRIAIKMNYMERHALKSIVNYFLYENSNIQIHKFRSADWVQYGRCGDVL